MDGVDLVIFTDLDGTLLDYKTYSFDPARDALEKVRQRGIPLVLCTSKTRAEVARYRQRLNNDDPFIVENGGAAFIPAGYFPFAYPYQRDVNGYHVIEYGTPLPQVGRCIEGGPSREWGQDWRLLGPERRAGRRVDGSLGGGGPSREGPGVR
ncbi:MAG: HAD-IIB family hydrolase [Candidatus Methylomirabilis sp.]|nr:HAD-IIB family hydrolase [Candidatus Methylomirabilis sp.]